MLECDLKCGNAFSQKMCEAKAWFNWLKCKDDMNPPDDFPSFPDNDYYQSPEPGFWGA